MRVSNSGKDQALVTLGVFVYALFAYLWLRHQFKEAAQRDGGVWTPPRLVIVGMLVLGVLGLVAHYEIYANGYLFVVSLLIGLVGIGFAELALRGIGGAPTAYRLIGVGGAGLLVGLNFVDRPWYGAALAIVVLSWLVLASGIAIRSEQIASSTTGSPLEAGTPWWVSVAIWVAATVIACLLAGSWVMAFPFLGVALVMVTVSASTMVDIVLLTLVMAVMGWTAAQKDLPDSFKGIPAAGAGTLVVLGDSYISGEGAEEYYAGTDGNAGARGEPNMCRRSPNSWAAQLGEAQFDHTIFLACSGARTFNLMHDAKPDSGDASVLDPGPQSGEEMTQLDAYRALVARSPHDDVAHFDPDLVVLSLGGNDAGFSAIGLMCVAPGDCGDKDNLWLDTLPVLENQLNDAFAQVRSAFKNTPVVVIPYPDPIHNPKAPCDVPLTKDDRRFIVQYVEALNARVRSAALNQGFYFVTVMQEALATHRRQLCDPHTPKDGPGINFINPRSTAGGASERFSPANWTHNSLHPNKRGHDALFSVFDEWLAEHSDLAVVDPKSGYELPSSLPTFDKIAPAKRAQTDPPCDLFDVPGNAPECRSESTRWALGQVSAQLLSRGYGLLLLVAALAAWSAALTFFRWRRRTSALPEDLE